MQLDAPIAPVRPVETVPVTHEGTEYIVLRDPQGFSESMIAISPEAMPILAMFDGSKNAKDIVEEIEVTAGAAIDPEQVASMAQVLDKAYLLQNHNFLEHRLRVEEEFNDREIREAALAGGGYPDDPDKLREFLDHLLRSPLPDDFEPEPLLQDRPLRGLLLPHIDFHRGGQTYGRAYKAVLNLLSELEEGPLLVGIIGVAHQGAQSPLVVCSKDFDTPLGPLHVNKSAIDLLRSRFGEAPFREQWVHKSEHSVELQAVWIKHLMADREVTILPMLAGMLDGPVPSGNGIVSTARQLLDTLKEIEEKHPGPVLWIASVDFSHVGPQFGDPEVIHEKQIKAVLERDMEALSSVREVDGVGWWDALMQEDNRYRVCGINATYLLLELLKESNVAILDYDKALAEDRHLMVTYAAAIFQA